VNLAYQNCGKPPCFMYSTHPVFKKTSNLKNNNPTMERTISIFLQTSILKAKTIH